MLPPLIRNLVNAWIWRVNDDGAWICFCLQKVWFRFAHKVFDTIPQLTFSFRLDSFIRASSPNGPATFTPLFFSFVASSWTPSSTITAISFEDVSSSVPSYHVACFWLKCYFATAGLTLLVWINWMVSFAASLNLVEFLIWENILFIASITCTSEASVEVLNFKLLVGATTWVSSD